MEEVDKEVGDLLACHTAVEDTLDTAHIQEQRVVPEADLLVIALDVAT